VLFPSVKMLFQSVGGYILKFRTNWKMLFICLFTSVGGYMFNTQNVISNGIR